MENPADDFDYGTTIESFFQWINADNTTCYFHNLKFDGHFIMDWLMKQGYTHEVEQGPTGKGTFKTLISAMGMFYSLTVYWRNGKMTEFKDSLKKIPMPVEAIAKSWNLEEGKGEIDYKATRPKGYEPTVAEWDYVRRDVLIVALAMQEILAEGMTRLTVGSDSLAEYKSLIGTKLFDKLFPVLDDDMDDEIRRAYRGGFTYVADRYRGYRTRSGLVLDVNSLYPSVMARMLLPYGEPEFVEGVVTPTEDHPLTIFSITFTAKLKPDHVPCIQIKGSSMFGETDYLKVIKEPTTLMVTDIDWKLYQDHYDIEVQEYGGGWRFKGAYGMFDSYIDKWSAIKEAATGGKREIAKLHLNTLYGKFATNPNVTSKYPVLEDGMVKLKMGVLEKRRPVYTAMGVFITSYARDLTVRAAQENYDTFAYADTDSLHLLTDTIPTSIDIHPTRMGAWKHEYDFAEAYYIRPKAYLEKHHAGYHPKSCVAGCAEVHYTNAFAGLPRKVSKKLVFDDLVHGRNLKGKLYPTVTSGGIVLTDYPYVLKLH